MGILDALDTFGHSGHFWELLGTLGILGTLGTGIFGIKYAIETSKNAGPQLKKKVYPLFQILGFTSSTKDDPIDLKFWLHF